MNREIREKEDSGKGRDLDIVTLDSNGAAPLWLGDRALGWKAWLGSDSCCGSVIRTLPDGTGPGWVQMPRSLGTQESVRWASRF